MDIPIKKTHDDELEKVRSQFYIFYELTKVMRTTLRLEEIVYIILTGLTAHHGLAFNRAVLFLVDEEKKNIKGFMGIGPMYSEEANAIWTNIKEENKDLYELIKAYHRIKEEDAKPKFMEFIQSLAFPLAKESGFIFDSLFEMGALRIKEEKTLQLKDDPLISKLQLKEFLASSLWIKNRPAGIIIVDNYITRKPISDEDVKIFKMFVDQAAGAIENSQAFENTLMQAHTDTLTGIWNHGFFQYKLDEELARAKSQNHPVSLMMIDLDDFKKFNDTYGHVAGDNALRRIADILKDKIRKIDVLCRYGGEEFSIILPLTKKEEASYLGERIRKAICENKILENNFSVSVGISAYPHDTQEKELLVKMADEALYRAKREGKNRVILA